MTGPGPAAPDPYQDALLAARLCAIDPMLGGIVLRGGGELRDAVQAELMAGLAADAPLRRVPVHIDDDRLLGGLDLAASLARGAAISRKGLLAEADGGVIVVPMAERMLDATAARIAATIDSGEVIAECDGAALHSPARSVLLVLDDGIEPDERPPSALAERIAFWIDLSTARQSGPLEPRRRRKPKPLAEVSTEILSTLVTTAAALGVDTARAPMFALRAARASAELGGRRAIEHQDLAMAARLVLAPRATRLPAAAPEETAPEPPAPEPDTDGQDDKPSEPQPLEDIVLAAALASLPKDVLARLASGAARRGPTTRAHGAGERRKSAVRGRPTGIRAAAPTGGQRLSLIDTLRAAAPWQKLRGRDGPIQIRRDDLRIRRFESRAEALTIFAVDASGSSALARLAEAKGAVELLLAEAYTKRTQVALVAFRGTSAEVLLPPTRSLTRARKSLADLPGGGGTPLAAGLNAARELAETARARGRTPFVVVLTDGKANIANDGSAVRARAITDAENAAKAIGQAGIASAFVDISARPRAEGAVLAAAMGAHYLPLPRANSATMHAAVSAAQRE